MDNWDMSTGVILLSADNLCNRSLACCSTAITKASCTAFPNSPAKIKNIRNKKHRLYFLVQSSSLQTQIQQVC